MHSIKHDRAHVWACVRWGLERERETTFELVGRLLVGCAQRHAFKSAKRQELAAGPTCRRAWEGSVNGRLRGRSCGKHCSDHLLEDCDSWAGAWSLLATRQLEKDELAMRSWPVAVDQRPSHAGREHGACVESLGCAMCRTTSLMRAAKVGP